MVQIAAILIAFSNQVLVKATNRETRCQAGNPREWVGSGKGSPKDSQTDLTYDTELAPNIKTQSRFDWVSGSNLDLRLFFLKSLQTNFNVLS